MLGLFLPLQYSLTVFFEYFSGFLYHIALYLSYQPPAVVPVLPKLSSVLVQYKKSVHIGFQMEMVPSVHLQIPH